MSRRNWTGPPSKEPKKGYDWLSLLIIVGWFSLVIGVVLYNTFADAGP